MLLIVNPNACLASPIEFTERLLSKFFQRFKLSAISAIFNWALPPKAHGLPLS
jgi:hypothetical protein